MHRILLEQNNAEDPIIEVSYIFFGSEIVIDSVSNPLPQLTCGIL